MNDFKNRRVSLFSKPNLSLIPEITQKDQQTQESPTNVPPQVIKKQPSSPEIPPFRRLRRAMSIASPSNLNRVGQNMTIFLEFFVFPST